MKNHHPRKMLPPGTSRKRKHAEADEPAKPKAAEPVPSNRLLAGYLAHEFLTKGTLFGQKFDSDSTRFNSKPLTRSNKTGSNKSQLNSQAVEPSRQSVKKENESYDEVASIMKTDGTHIKGIVNPTQLSHWIRM
ncbi:hypothetical protein Lal_00021551 [Lupinus albus]|uniref:Uncharacterized protein n=1 Tax=Lupinus albus TaxID=3870 RepID=A0A6A5LKA0_LUPAL|nr:hypothetical protein Lalb_Chr21g0312201 [Lupinus albus]KAF1860508.1 hypothetical protein Lal_00021551 [Lupinus albus]